MHGAGWAKDPIRMRWADYMPRVFVAQVSEFKWMPATPHQVPALQQEIEDVRNWRMEHQ